ncbi:hypothetical protein DIE04_19005 [Burkholderia sp. Bp8994]|uniref:hypothetical protein n=1 Tax=Burkholderia sp. Bp8994 TaxID=2184555 RepID=UPI000F5AD3E2|nr:hypothetical protein [Burkholderia sp. Bp8994]RQR94545.1 hypothetical protein DIE04_19005 [Burkholderia sp. Bp8994]
MAEIIHMPTRQLRKGRRREKPIQGAPLADVIDDIDFRAASKPTYEEIKASLDKLAYHLIWASRAAKEIFPAYE